MPPDDASGTADMLMALALLVLVAVVMWLVVSFSNDTFNGPSTTLPPVTAQR